MTQYYLLMILFRQYHTRNIIQTSNQLFKNQPLRNEFLTADYIVDNNISYYLYLKIK